MKKARKKGDKRVKEAESAKGLRDKSRRSGKREWGGGGDGTRGEKGSDYKEKSWIKKAKKTQKSQAKE